MGGDSGHHIKPKTMAMMMENGKLSTNNKGHMSVFDPCVDKFLNAESTTYALTAEYIKQQEGCPNLDKDLERAKLLRVMRALKNDKAPGLNSVPPNAFKCTVCLPSRKYLNPRRCLIVLTTPSNEASAYQLSNGIFKFLLSQKLRELC